MPSTDRRLELKEKTSMAQTVWQPAMYANGLRRNLLYGVDCLFVCQSVSQSGSTVKVGSGHGKVEVCCEHDNEPLWLFGIFVRRILRKMSGPVQNEDGFWRIRKNYKLNDLIKNPDIVRFVKSKKMAWLGHVMWTEGK